MVEMNMGHEDCRNLFRFDLTGRQFTEERFPTGFRSGFNQNEPVRAFHEEGSDGTRPVPEPEIYRMNLHHCHHTDSR